MQKTGGTSPVSAELHLFIPFETPHTQRLRVTAMKSEEWEVSLPDTAFYLKYVRASIGRTPSSRLLILENKGATYDIVFKKTGEKERLLALRGARIYSFDTDVAILELRVFVEGDSLAAVADAAAFLRMTDNPRLCLRTEAGDRGGSMNGIAEELLAPLGAHHLFPHVTGEDGIDGARTATRADFLAAVLADSAVLDPMTREHDLLRIADGMSLSYSGDYGEDAKRGLYTVNDYLQWCISRKGACTLAVRREGAVRDEAKYVGKWKETVDARHTFWYVLVLHQKYAMYRYMNEVAGERSERSLRRYQRSVVLFNTAYRFEIISEESRYQALYQLAREMKSVESVFADTDEEIERMNEYHEVRKNDRVTTAMTIVSVVCALSTLIDILLLGDSGFSGLTWLQWLLLACFGVAAVLAGVHLILRPLLALIRERILSPIRRRWLAFITRKHK